MILKYLITVYFILIIAILANTIAEILELETWYKFLKRIINSGLKDAIKNTNILNTLWLFIIYPLVLSFGYTFLWKLPQCPQVRDSNTISLIFASTLPSEIGLISANEFIGKK